MSELRRSLYFLCGAIFVTPLVSLAAILFLEDFDRKYASARELAWFLDAVQLGILGVLATVVLGIALLALRVAEIRIGTDRGFFLGGIVVAVVVRIALWLR